MQPFFNACSQHGATVLATALEQPSSGESSETKWSTLCKLGMSRQSDKRNWLTVLTVIFTHVLTIKIIHFRYTLKTTKLNFVVNCMLQVTFQPLLFLTGAKHSRQMPETRKWQQQLLLAPQPQETNRKQQAMSLAGMNAWQGVVRYRVLSFLFLNWFHFWRHDWRVVIGYMCVCRVKKKK